MSAAYLSRWVSTCAPWEHPASAIQLLQLTQLLPLLLQVHGVSSEDSVQGAAPRALHGHSSPSAVAVAVESDFFDLDLDQQCGDP